MVQSFVLRSLRTAKPDRTESLLKMMLYWGFHCLFSHLWEKHFCFTWCGGGGRLQWCWGLNPGLLLSSHFTTELLSPSTVPPAPALYPEPQHSNLSPSMSVLEGTWILLIVSRYSCSEKLAGQNLFHKIL